MGFGVLAPSALQGAAFEKQGCADARAIVEAKPLNIKQESCVFLAFVNFHPFESPPVSAPQLSRYDFSLPSPSFISDVSIPE